MEADGIARRNEFYGISEYPATKIRDKRHSMIDTMNINNRRLTVEIYDFMVFSTRKKSVILS